MFEKIETNNVIKNKAGDLPATTAVLSNNQIGRYVSRENATILKNVFSATANGFGRVFYQPREFTVLQDSYAFKFKDSNIDISKIHSFVVGALNKVYVKYDWANKSGWTKVKKEKIYLPTKNGEIDFDFMERFVSQLEAFRLSQLEAYLLVTGLKDYKLTTAEQQALADFKGDKVKWAEFRIGDLFEVNTSKKRFDANKVEVLEKGFPYVVRTASNNGVKGFLNESSEYLNEGDTISFGQDTATMFYQKQPYFTGDKIKILKSKNEKIGEKTAQFFISSMAKTFSSFSWGSSSFSVGVIEGQKIHLPTKEEGQDEDYMQLLISAVQKLVIKDVVLYTDRKIAATREIVDR